MTATGATGGLTDGVVRCKLDPLAGTRLYPAYDWYHEGDAPGRQPVDDRHTASRAERLVAWLVRYRGDGTTGAEVESIYGPGESLDEWRARMARERAATT